MDDFNIGELNADMQFIENNGTNYVFQILTLVLCDAAYSDGISSSVLIIFDRLFFN